MLFSLASLIAVLVILGVGFSKAHDAIIAQEIEALHKQREEYNRELKRRRHLGVVDKS